MSGITKKSRISVIAYQSLPPEVRIAVINAKKVLREDPGIPRAFGNTQGRYEGDGPPLPKCRLGYEYREFQVGAAHPDDARPAGRRRLVIEVHPLSGHIGEIYYSEEHYEKGSFLRVR